MRRREFITLLGGAVAWPLAARAQQPERMRRIGVLMSLAADDPEMKARLAAFLQGLQALGWTDGRNVRIDTRSAAGDAERIRRYAAELVALAPDVILASGGQVVGGIAPGDPHRADRVHADPDPVGAGFVASLAQPGGNATGFTQFEYGISAKWLELLKEIAPRVTRAAVLRDPHHTRRDRPVRHNPGCGAVARGGVAPDRCAQRARDRASRHGIRTRGEWRPDRDGESVGERSSRTDYHAGGPAPIACGLPFPLLRHRRRPDLLRAGFDRPASARGGLCRSYPQWREASRFAGAGADQI